jgi:hypothetical protein
MTSIASEWIIQIGAVKEEVQMSTETRVFLVDVGLAKIGMERCRGCDDKDIWTEKDGGFGVSWNGKWVLEIERSI